MAVRSVETIVAIKVVLFGYIEGRSYPIFLAILTVIAAGAAAVAAWFSYNVSQKTLQFQKDLATNQHVYIQLTSILNKLLKIRLLLNDIYGSPDEEFRSLEKTFNEIKKEIEALSYQITLDKDVLDLLNHSSVSTLVDEILNPSIAAIQKTFKSIWG